MNSPLVSIIIPTYNYGYLISDTLDDILHQTYSNWECIVVDDGSKDDTEEKVRPYLERDKRFRYIFQKNQGLSAARNTGMKQAQGEFIQLLDSDDKLENDKLRVHVEELMKDPSVDIVYGNVRYFTTEDPSLRLFDMKTIKAKHTWMPCVSGKGTEILAHFVKGNIMVVNAPVFRKKIVEKVGYFDEHLKALEDWDFWVRCALAGMSFKYSGREGSLALVRSHTVSMTKNDILMYAANLKFREKFAILMETDDDGTLKKMLRYNRIQLHKLYSEAACDSIRKGNLATGWRKIFHISSKTDYPWVYYQNGLRYTRKYFKGKLLQLLKR